MDMRVLLIFTLSALALYCAARALTRRRFSTAAALSVIFYDTLCTWERLEAAQVCEVLVRNLRTGPPGLSPEERKLVRRLREDMGASGTLVGRWWFTWGLICIVRYHVFDEAAYCRFLDAQAQKYQAWLNAPEKAPAPSA